MLRGDALCILTRPAPRVPLEAFLSLPLDGERLLWDDARDGVRENARELAHAQDETWAFAARGAAARVDAWGERCFDEARVAADRIFSQILDVDRLPAPLPRLFGGLSFQPRGRAEAPWTGFADASFVLPRWTYCVSKDTAFVRVTALGNELRGAEDRLLTVVRELERAASERRPVTEAPPATNGARLVEMERRVWDELVGDALRSIRSRELAKVVASRRSAVTLRAPIDLPRTIAKMRALEPSCTRFAVEREGGVFLGATPERLVRVEGQRLDADALAGSIPRRDGSELAELESSDKDQREHALVVDGIRAALAPLAEPIEVPRAPVVRSLRALHHLFTPIRATLRERTHVLDVVRALHPTPAVCGLPRDVARGWICAHEPTPRGWYASPVGYFDASGDGTFAVGIRSALVKGSEAWLFVGAGIVDGSDAALEYHEAGVKQTTMLATLGVTE